MARVESIEEAAYPDASELISEDGIPLETPWHRAEIGVLIDSLAYHWRDRDDFYVGGNMFIYFSAEQARNRDYRGPDFFFVDGVRRRPPRPYWAVWLEGFKFPDLIIELTSPSTAREDRTTKKDLYERTFQTREYILLDPDDRRTEGWRLDEEGHYQPIPLDARGRLWCETVGFYLGPWEGPYGEFDEPASFHRFFTPRGDLILLPGEAERVRADEERNRADEASLRADEASLRANEASLRADEASLRADEASLRVEEARLRAEEAVARAEAERQRADASAEEAARLRALLAELQGRQ